MYNQDAYPMTPKELTLALGGEWKGSSGMAACPAHDDNNPSLSISKGDRQPIVLKCHAGCSQEQVLGSLIEKGLWPARMGGAVPDSGHLSSHQEQGDSEEEHVTSGQTMSLESIMTPISTTSIGHSSSTWKYHDEHGNVLFKVCRYDDANGKKGFIPRTRYVDEEGNEKWETGAFPKPRPLYGLHRLAASAGLPVLIVEGEKAADAAASLFPDHVVMTWFGGSNAVHNTDFSPLVGREVTVWPDADEPGEKAAMEVRHQCVLSGASSVRIVELSPDLPKGWDLADPHSCGDVGKWARQKVNDAQVPALPWNVLDEAAPTAAPQISLSHFPSALLDFSTDVAARIGVDPIAIALPALTVVAASIDDGHNIQPKDKDTAWTESARLWTVIVADPGYKKSPALKSVLGPLQQIEGDWVKSDMLTIKAWEIDKSIYDVELKAHVSKAAKGKGSPTARPQEPTKPPRRRKIVNDTTTEALVDVCVDNAWGLLCFNDELTSWLGSFDAYRSKGQGGKDQPFWLSAWNGGPHTVDRKTGTTVVENLGISVLGGVQPERLRRVSDNLVEDGLLSRFIAFHGDGVSMGLDQAPNQAAINIYERAIKKLADHAPQPNAPPFTLEHDAGIERQNFVKKVDRFIAKQGLPGHLKAHLRKWEGIHIRIVLTIHLFNWAIGNASTPPVQVDKDTVAMAARLMFEVLLPHACRFYGETLGMDRDRHAVWIAGHVLARGKEKITISEIKRVYHETRNDEKVIKKAMSTLEVAGWVTPLENPNRYGDIKEWEVDPVVHKLFANFARAERKRRDELIEKIRKNAKAPGKPKGGEA